MSFTEWLETPVGQAAVHALIVLLVAIAGYIQVLTQRAATENKQRLDELHEKLSTLSATSAIQGNTLERIVSQVSDPHNI